MAMTEETEQWLKDVEDQPAYIAKIKAALKEHKMSQAEFADRCGCSAPNISLWLSGRNYWMPIPKYIWEQARWLPGMRPQK